MIDAREKWREVRALDAPGTLALGPNTYDRYQGDPRRIGFMLARYAAAARFLKDCSSIIDVGCGDGFGTLTLQRCTSAGSILGIDFDEDLIRHAMKSQPAGVQYLYSDLMGPLSPPRHDGLCSLDVIEHIDPTRSLEFVGRCAAIANRVAVIGTPNKLAAQYASAHSNTGHINLLTPDELESQMKTAFKHVVILAMNDSVVHLGNPNMAFYLIGVGFK